MPRLWNETIEAHRRDVTDSILATTAALVTEHGIRAVTMSQIAEQVGIGRATLYKYYPNVEAILIAWQHRRIAGHLAELTELSDGPSPAIGRLSNALRRYASITHESHNAELASLLHPGGHLEAAQDQLHGLMTRLIEDAVRDGSVRTDVPPSELASFSLHAIGAACDVKSAAARERLVALTMDALLPRR